MFTALQKLPRDARDTLLLLAVVAWIIAPLTPYIPPWTSALAALVLLWRGWIAVQGRTLPSRWLLAGLLAVSVALTLSTHRTIVGRDAGVTLIVMLLALKTLELRARRDAMVVFFLGFFTMLSNFFFSQSLPTAAAMLVALLGLLTALVNAHLPVGRPPLAQSLATAVRMALWGAPIMAALFVLFPRMAPLWSMPSDTPTGRSGLSNEMEVGSVAALAMDETIALRVRFDTPGNAPPEQSALYFRGPVLSQFDGRLWRMPDGLIDATLARRAAAQSGLQVQGAPLAYEITLERSPHPWLLLLDAAPQAPQLPSMGALMTPQLSWVATRPISDVLRLRAVSYPQFSHGVHTPPAELAEQTALPPGSNPRTLALARQMRAELAQADTPALVHSALDRLRTGGYRYTLEPGVYGAHTADEFWFDRKEGFCEHIASAFAVLMRGMGVPARIVTGYQGGERNPVDGYWTVRQSDAHAWTEVWMPGKGWVRIDPTGAVSPGRVGEFMRLAAPRGAFADAMGAVISPSMAQQMRAVWEAVNNGWNQWVLNYTQSRQMDLLRNLGFASPTWQDLARLLGLLAGAAALMGIAWALWERRRTDPWSRLLAQARARLARAGLDAPAHLPPRALAERAQAQFGAQASAASAWLLQLEQLRYAPHPPADALARLRRAARTLPWPRPGRQKPVKT